MELSLNSDLKVPSSPNPQLLKSKDTFSAISDEETFSSLIPDSFYNQAPQLLTFLTTYRCNAQCEQCCFESNPTIQGKLTLQEMCNYIDRAVENFPALQLVVFTGGECFLLGEDLFRAISYASQKGFSTRCVTNAFWGKTAKIAKKKCEKTC